MNNIQLDSLTVTSKNMNLIAFFLKKIQEHKHQFFWGAQFSKFPFLNDRKWGIPSSNGTLERFLENCQIFSFLKKKIKIS